MMMLKDSNKDEILQIDQDEAKLALQQLFGSQIVLRNSIYMAHKITVKYIIYLIHTKTVLRQ